MAGIGLGPRCLAFVVAVATAWAPRVALSASDHGSGVRASAGNRDEPAPSGTRPVPMPTTVAQPVGEVDATLPPGPGARAQAAFETGEKLLAQGRFQEAAEAFARSNAAIPNGPALYNQAYCYERAGLPAEALRTYRAYLSRGDVGVAERRDLETTLRELRSQVAELVLDVEPGVTLTEIRLDGGLITTGDFPHLVDPGPHTVEFMGERPEHHRIRTIEVAGGQVIRIDVPAFVDPPAPQPVPPVSEPTDPAPADPGVQKRVRAQRITFWSGVGLTAASGIGLAILGALTVGAKNDFEAAQCGTPSSEDCSYPEMEERRFESRKLATNVMIGVTAGLALATAIVGVVVFAPRATDRKGAGDSKRAQARVTLGPGGLHLRF